MRIEEIVFALENRQKEMEKSIFNSPPQTFDDFKTRAGIWRGLGDAISVITELAQKEKREDE